MIVRIYLYLFFSGLAVLPLASPVAAQSDTVLHPATTCDEKLFLQINHWGEHLPWLDHLAIALSGSASYVDAGMPIGLYLYGFAKKDASVTYAAASIAISEVTSGLITEGIKLIVRRPRPYHVLEDVRLPSARAGDWSFPSGHATAAWALSAGLSFHFQKWYVIAPSLIYATAVSLSRPYLGVHYPSDLIVGAIIGSATSYVVYRLEDKLFAHTGAFLNPRPNPMEAPSIHTLDPTNVGLQISLPINFY